MVLTSCECLLLLCCGIAVGLFCWLSYTSLCAAQRHRPEPHRMACEPQAPAAEDAHGEGVPLAG